MLCSSRLPRRQTLEELFEALHWVPGQLNNNSQVKQTFQGMENRSSTREQSKNMEEN